MQTNFLIGGKKSYVVPIFKASSTDDALNIAENIGTVIGQPPPI